MNPGGTDRDSDVNLYGYEGPPSLKDRDIRMNNEVLVINKCINDVDKYISLGIDIASKGSSDDNSELKKQLLELVTVLTHRVKDLRRNRVGKALAREKFKGLGQADWRSSKFAYVISSIETSICRIDMCLKSIMEVIDSILATVAIINGTRHHFHAGRPHVDMNSLDNHCCLKSDAYTRSLDTKHMIQKSEIWFEERRKSKVTGSRVYSAIGMDTLKGQQQHFDEVIFGAQRPEFDEQSKANMLHGTENENNAKSTLLTKVLPVYYPELIYYEEGCYTMSHNDQTLLLVSPDGSAREATSGDVGAAVEFKCPVPGKAFTTPVHYTIPTRYITQLICEMGTLNSKKLIYISWSKSTSTVFEVTWDQDLWEQIMAECTALYGDENPRRPTKKSDNSKMLKEQIGRFNDVNVKLIAEVMSTTGHECKHQDNEDDDFHHVHASSDRGCSSS